MGNNYYLSDKLFARPSFIGGMASVLDIWGTLQEYNSSKTGKEADNKALLGDWMAVGRDLTDAVNSYEQGTSK